MQNNSLWTWYKANSHTLEVILNIACDLIPGGNMAKHGVDLWIAKLEDNKEIDQHQERTDIDAFIKEAQPILDAILNIIQQNQLNEQNLTADKLKTFANNHPLFKTAFDNGLMELDQTVNKTLCKTTKKRIINQRYELGKRLGKGGQAEVYLAWEINNRRKPVAIKLLPAILSEDESAIEQLEMEYDILVDQLRHTHIVAYTALEQDKETQNYYIVMDYIEGKNLRQILLARYNKPFSLKEALVYLTPIAEALDFAHQNEIVHCDIKPENILIRNSDQRVFLTDFGLASKIRQTLTIHLNSAQQQNNISGTLPYMAPEQYLGQLPRAQTDTWALGVVLYELLAGEAPFNGASMDHFEKLICKNKPAKIKGLSKKADALVNKMITKNKSERPIEIMPIFRALQKIANKKEAKKIKIFITIMILCLFGFSGVYLYESSLYQRTQRQPNIKKYQTYLTQCILCQYKLKAKQAIQQLKAQPKKIKTPSIEPEKQPRPVIAKVEPEKPILPIANKKPISEKQTTTLKGEKIKQYWVYPNGTVQDTQTHLMWKRCPEGLSGMDCSIGERETATYYEALATYQDISYAGYNDWRLPTTQELHTLVYCSNGIKPEYIYIEDGYWSTKDCSDGDKDYQKPTINQQVFPNNSSDTYWSSSPYVNDTVRAWSVNFEYGNAFEHYKSSSKLFVRLVRAG